MPEMEDVPFFFPDFSLMPPALLDERIRQLMTRPLVYPYQDFGDDHLLPHEQFMALCQARNNYWVLEYALAQLGVARLRAGDLDAAEGVLRTIVMMGSWHVQVFDCLFTIYVKQNAMGGAFWVLAEAVQRVNHSGMDYHYAKAKFLRLLERATQYKWDAQGRAKKMKRPRKTSPPKEAEDARERGPEKRPADN
jgi:hypothetical protein